MQESELVTYWRLFTRWWWLLVLAGTIGGVLGYLYSRTQTPVYEASALILVEGQGGSTGGVDFTSQQSAQTISQLITTRPVLDEVSKRLSLSGRPSVSSSARQAFIQIRAVSGDPGLAAAAANVTADVIVQTVRDRQLTQIAQFQNSLATYGVAPDPLIVATQAARIANLSIVEPAIAATVPVQQASLRYLVIAALAGLLLGGVAVWGLEQLRDTISTDEELSALTGFESIGVVPRYPVENNYTAVALSGHGNRAAIGAYEFVRANLEFVALAQQRKLSRVLLTSAGVGDGKTTTAVNLAAVFAREGKRVILVDLDLRHPGVRRFFHPAPLKGVTNIVVGDATIEEALFTPPGVEGFQVLTTGPLPANPISVMRTQRFQEMVARLQEKADIVVIDSPPILAVPDPLLLAKMVDVVVLVADSSKSRRGAVRRAARLLSQAGPPLVGALLNKVAVNRGPQYYQYYYYTQYYSKAGRNGSNGSGRGLRMPRLGRRANGSGTDKSPAETPSKPS